MFSLSVILRRVSLRARSCLTNHLYAVVTPQKFGDVYLYNQPPGSQRYDVPPSLQDTLSPLQPYDIPRTIPCENLLTRRNTPASPLCEPEADSQSYDVPRPLGAPNQVLTPSSSISSLTAPESLSLPSSNRSSILSGPDYDVPKPRVLPTSQLYDVPAPNPKPKELPLELGSALESLNRLQNEAASAVQRLLGLFTPSWRKPENLRNGILEIKLSAERLRTSLHELSEFCEGSLGNAHKAADKSLVTKLKPLSKALNDANRIIQDSCNELDMLNWEVDKLSREKEEETNFDCLDRLISCAKSLTEDIRRAASFLQGNAPLLFKKGSSPALPEDYDYVNLDKQTEKNKSQEIRDTLPPELRKSYDEIINSLENNYEKADTVDSDDDRLIRFYAALTVSHTAQLTKAIDAFLKTVEHNQPPKIFLAHGKFVVLNAHRLVHVGDTVARNISQTHIKQQIQEHADGLSEALDLTVQRTKRAAQHFPNVAAVQDMVDAIVDVSHFARDLKVTLVLAVQWM
ncbi:UNVERIFIED_CONTAM: hypothetical protein PYX00_008271 [Menopon gallinae]|uniref:Breast cancer anti-estrogen resistance 1 n=1 Tax=Menopon gallinae TaxID=328185 RepID=A0AAW2HMK9_9NEOP